MNASERNPKIQADGLYVLEVQRVTSCFLCGIIKKQSNATVFFFLGE